MWNGCDPHVIRMCSMWTGLRMWKYRKLFGTPNEKTASRATVLSLGFRVKSGFHMCIGCDPHVIRMWSMWTGLHMWKYRKLLGISNEKTSRAPRFVSRRNRIRLEKRRAYNRLFKLRADIGWFPTFRQVSRSRSILFN